MSKALYRTYRPSTFGAVAGQEHVKRTLRNQLLRGTVSHAYLFSGPRGVGKTTLARLLAKGVNCAALKDGEPCGACPSCKAFDQNRTLDIIEIDAASHTGVDNVRENIIEAVRVPPSIGSRKVFIVDEVHMLSTSAFNALLKTLEEPPAHALFVLATTEVHKIPQTILSRCQRFDFKRVDAGEMKGRLSWIGAQEGVTVDNQVLDAVVRVSEGCLRDAESLLGQLIAIGEKNIDVEAASLVLPITYTTTALDLFEVLFSFDGKGCLDHLGTFVTQGGSIRQFTNECVSLVRAMLFIQLGSGDDAYDETTAERLRTFSGRLEVGQSRWLLDSLLAAKVKPASDIFPQLPLELVCVEFIEKFKKDRNPGGGPGRQDGSNDGSGRMTKDNVPRKDEGSEIASHFVPPGGTSRDRSSVEPPRNCEGEQKEEKKEGGESEVPPAASFSVEDLASKWKRCCEAVAQHNIALPLVLQKARPIAVEDGCVHLGFEHTFHVDTIDQPKNVKIVERAINEIMQSSITLRIVQLAKTPRPIDDIAHAFGGTVIE